MRRIRYGVGMSLNGFIADDRGQTDFLVSDPAYDPAPFFDSIDSVIMGRVTYEVAVRMGMRAYAGLQNYVVSRTLEAAEYPEVTVVRDTAALAELRQSPGRDVWLCGGGILLASLLSAGLVDTIELGVSPTLVTRQGIPMLAPGTRLPPAVALELTHYRVLPTGMLVLEYAVPKRA